MGKEQSPTPQEPFDFTENERLFDRISHQRFEAIVHHQEIDIHEVTLSSNSYGEFLFVTVSRTQESKRQTITFWGLGYHEYRERWIDRSWSWFDSQRSFENIVPKEHAITQIEARRQDVLAWNTHEKPSKRAELYSLLADLSDEDGAITELDDLSDFLDLDE